MKDQDKESKDRLSELRRRAEVAAENSLGVSDVSALSPEEVQQLIHELQVHQIELEMQNEELRQELEASRDKNSDLYDLAPVGYLVLDQAGVIQQANITVAGLLGRARASLIGKPFSSFVNEEDGNTLYLHFRQILETQSKQTCDVRLAKNDGSHIPVRLDSQVLGSQDDSRTLLRTVLTAITSRTSAEDALYALESRYRRLFEKAQDGILLVDFDTGKVLDVNQYLIDMLGYSHEEFLDKYLWEVSPFNDTALSKDAFAELLEKGYIRREDLPLETSDGRSIDVEVVSTSHLVCGVTFIQCNIRDITDRKRTEEALKESEERYRAVVDNLEIGISLLNSKMEIVGANKALKRFFSHVLPGSGQVCYEHYNNPPRSELCSYCPCVLTFQDGEVHEATTETPADSGVRYYHIISSPIKDSEGQVQYVIELTEDITERKIAENLIHVRLALLEFAALHSLEELLQKILDEVGSLTNSPIGFFHFIGQDERNISLQAWSTRTVKEFCHVEGKGRHEPVDQGGVWVDAVRERRPVIHNDYATLPHHRGMPEGHAVVTRELVVPVFRSDRIVAILGIGNKPADYTDTDVKVVSYLADLAWEIVQRKWAEGAVKESDKQYRTLFEESIDGVCSVLWDGTITDANSSFCELFGYTSRELIGKNIRELYFTPADRPRFQEEIEKKGFLKDYELKLRKRDGTEVDSQLTSSVDFGEDGSITGYRSILRDLTESKKLHRQLLQAQKMEAVGTLAGGIAHDFNNILQVVLGYSELVFAEEDMPDRLRDDLGRVLLAARKGADLVQRLLTFSRKSEAKPLILDLNHRIRQTQKFLQRTISKMIDIELILADDLARVHADPTQMDQVLMNLAVNARDAMPEGGKLVIETANVFLDEECGKALLGVKPGEYVLLSLSDTGHGMDKETVAHIFEPFYTTKEAGKGTGLGLAMVYGIVKQHGGYIICYSEPGEGTTFKIYFPVIEMEIDQDVTTSGPMPAFGTETVLLVDDEEFLRDLGKRILERSGYTVLIAANGKEALDLYRRERGKISLVILDLIMPEMGGKECLEELLRIDPKARVLIASGFAANGQSKEAIEKGARGFVDKPYNVKRMLQAVREVLDSE